MAANLTQQLTAPNGTKYSQPLGLFINNEWRAAKSGQTITVVCPRLAAHIISLFDRDSQAYVTLS